MYFAMVSAEQNFGHFHSPKFFWPSVLWVFQKSLANNVADIANEEGHHPDIYIFYNIVDIELYTHAVKGLSENDFIMAAKIDKILT